MNLNHDIKRIAVIVTGGTISALGATPLDLMNYDHSGITLPADEMVGALPAFPENYELIVVDHGSTSSTQMDYSYWKTLGLKISNLQQETPGLAGVVITHGTASLEETAWFLQLTTTTDMPIVLVGSQRPANGLSSDAQLNLWNAIRVCGDEQSRGLGVLVVFNDEIHSARDVTKTSTYRVETFQSPEFGPLGVCDPDHISFYRRPLRVGATPPLDINAVEHVHKVGITYCYAGSEGDVIDAMVGLGYKGIVVAGFAPGCCTASELTALDQAVSKGVTVVMSSRAHRGRVGSSIDLENHQIISADNLNPQKARLLLALLLASDCSRQEVRTAFAHC